MITRITNLMTSQQLLANINSSQDAIANTEEQLSTGKRINQPSDDPYGASLAVQLNGTLAQLGSYSNNVTDGTAWTQAGLTAMQSISNQLQRAQEIVVQANNGTESAADMQAAGQEIDQLIDGIKSDADTQYNGQYVFSGSQTTVEPYASGANDTYQGDTGSVTRVVGPGSPVAVNGQLSSVLGGVPDANGTPSAGLLSQLRSISTALANGDSSGLSGALTDLTNSLNSLEQVQATVGAANDRLQLAGTRISSLQTSTTSALSDDQDANMAQTLTTYSNEQAAFTAALKAGASIIQTSLMDFLSTS